MTLAIERADHLGLRVTDPDATLTFYERLGFRLIHRAVDSPMVLLHACGVELHVFADADRPFDGENRLVDVDAKYPGYTHMALRVRSVEATTLALRELGVHITEGPIRTGPGRSIYTRDPDGNVLEFRESK